MKATSISGNRKGGDLNLFLPKELGGLGFIRPKDYVINLTNF